MEWTVVRQRTQDEDRLHVHAPDGSEAGWMNLGSGHIALAQEFYRSGFTAALTRWRLEQTDQDRPDGSPPPAPSEGGTRVLTAPARVIGQRTPERTLGLLGRLPKPTERKVAAELDRLLPAWQVLDEVPIGPAGTAADHLVIGPAGVVTVNAENLPGSRVYVDGDTFLLGGKPVPYLRRAAAEAERAGRLLSAACGFPVDVRAMLVLVGEVALTVETPPTDVYVTTRRNVALDLTRMPRTLTPAVVEAITAAARRPETWSRP